MQKGMVGAVKIGVALGALALVLAFLGLFSVSVFAPLIFQTNTTSSTNTTSQYNTAGNYGFQLNVTNVTGGAGAISNVTFELQRPSGFKLNITKANTVNYTTFQNTSNGGWWVNLTQDQIGSAGSYSYRWFVNDTGNNWNVTPNTSFSIAQNTSLASGLFLNGTEGNRTYNVGQPYNFTTALNISKTLKIASNLTGWVVQSGTGTSLENESTLTMTPGKYNITGYFEGDGNYTSSSQTYWASVFGWANSTAYKNISINYAKSGTPVNIGCLVRNSNSSDALVGYYVEIYNGTTNFSAGRTDSNGFYNATLTMSSDASQDIKCAIYDNSTSYYNVSSNSTSSLSSDFASPGITITSPGAQGYGSTSVSFAYSASDTGSGISSCSYTLDGGTAVSSGSSVSTSISVLDGSHTLSASCTDAAGNSGSSSVTFSVSTGGVSSPSVSSPSADTTKIIIPSIAAGATKRISITKGGHGVSEVTVSVKNSATAIYIDIAKLPGKPANIIQSVTGNVYHYMEINKTNIKSEDIDKIKIRFAVNKSWMDKNNISADTLALNRFTTKWDKLTTTKVNETSDEIEYEADSPGLSVFAVSGEAKAAAPAQPEVPQAPTQPEVQPPAPRYDIVPYVAALALIIALVAAAVLYLGKGKKK